MNLFSYFNDDSGAWERITDKEVIEIYYNNNIKNPPAVAVLNNTDNLDKILVRNCRHHKFVALDDNNIICKQFNDNYTLDLLHDFYYIDSDEKYIILHIINSDSGLKEYIEQFNKHMNIRLPDEIKHRRKELCNLKKAYA